MKLAQPGLRERVQCWHILAQCLCKRWGWGQKRLRMQWTDYRTEIHVCFFYLLNNIHVAWEKCNSQSVCSYLMITNGHLELCLEVIRKKRLLRHYHWSRFLRYFVQWTQLCVCVSIYIGHCYTFWHHVVMPSSWKFLLLYRVMFTHLPVVHLQVHGS